MTAADMRIIDVPRIHDPRGDLTFVEDGNHVPCDIGRVKVLDASASSKSEPAPVGASLRAGLDQFPAIHAHTLNNATISAYASGVVSDGKLNAT